MSNRFANAALAYADATVSRSFDDAGVSGSATYSRCGLYRYALGRIWDPSAPRLAFVMLNPSTASERKNDPTVERCERRARAMGFGALSVLNIFAFRATDPAVLRQAPDPVGPLNDTALIVGLADVATVVCAWGTHGAHRHRGPQVEALLRGRGHALHHLGLSQAGHPRHPLYVPYAVEPTLWAVTPP